MLVRGLPAASQTSQAINGPAMAWRPEAHLLALAVDLLASANWQRQNGKGPKPKPVKRPASSATSRLGMSDDELLERIRTQHARLKGDASP